MREHKSYHNAPTEQPVRLTRRGKVVATIAALGLGAGILAGGEAVVRVADDHAAHQQLLEHPTRLPATEVDKVIVKPGQTAWGISREAVGEQGDPRPLMDIVSQEHPDGLQPGDTVLIPKELEQPGPK